MNFVGINVKVESKAEIETVSDTDNMLADTVSVTDNERVKTRE